MVLCVDPAGQETGGRGVAPTETVPKEEQEGAMFTPQGKKDEKEKTDLANTKEKTPMCLVNELSRYNKVRFASSAD